MAVLVYVSLPRLLLDLSARIIWLLLFCSVAFTLVCFLFFLGGGFLDDRLDRPPFRVRQCD